MSEQKWERLYVGRGWDSYYAEHGPPGEPQLSVAWVAFAPTGYFYGWRPATTLRGRLRDWWRRRQGWTFYDGNGRRA